MAAACEEEGVEERAVAEGDPAQVEDGDGQDPFVCLIPCGQQQVSFIDVEVSGSHHHEYAALLVDAHACGGSSSHRGILPPGQMVRTIGGGRGFQEAAVRAVLDGVRGSPCPLGPCLDPIVHYTPAV